MRQIERNGLNPVLDRRGERGKVSRRPLFSIPDAVVPENLGPRAKFVIDARADDVAIVDKGMVVDVVARRVLPVRVRKERQQFGRDGVNSPFRYPVAGESKAGERVDEAPADESAEISPLHFRSRHKRKLGRTLDNPQAVIASEKLQFAGHQSAQAEPELVSFEFRQRLA